MIINFIRTPPRVNSTCPADSGNPVTEGRIGRPREIGGRHVREEEEGRAEGLREADEAREGHRPEDARAAEVVQGDSTRDRQVALDGEPGVASRRFVAAPKARSGERVNASDDLPAACPSLAAAAGARPHPRPPAARAVAGVDVSAQRGQMALPPSTIHGLIGAGYDDLTSMELGRRVGYRLRRKPAARASAGHSPADRTARSCPCPRMCASRLPAVLAGNRAGLVVFCCDPRCSDQKGV